MSLKHLLLVGALALLAACSSNAPVIDESLSESELYRKAQVDLDAKNYGAAIETLRALEARYPFGRYADQAQLELIYAYYENSNWEEARAAASRFIRLHPDHPQLRDRHLRAGRSDRRRRWHGAGPSDEPLPS